MLNPNLDAILEGNSRYSLVIATAKRAREISDEALEKVFIKFYKEDAARTREYGGSGVGLSVVKAIMEQMHQKYGMINYDNGVSFWFDLEADGAQRSVPAERNKE